MKNKKKVSIYKFELKQNPAILNILKNSNENL